ncbi:hypothetical protein ACFSC4_04570 [Deinococcus malanensis]|uniref:hypothetical protein n=1 Tax=Deinococcus malanensis TaxID=1706855 RepID=UPI00362F5D74
MFMKMLPLSAATLGLTVLLTACPGPTPTPEVTHSLTVALSGASGAPVKVTNTSTGLLLFNDMLSGSKTFTGLKAGSVLSVEGGAVNNFTAPSAQNVTLDADKTVTLTYQPLVGSALSQSMITGQVTGTDLEMSNAYVGSAKSTFFGKIPLTRNSMNYDLSALVPGTEDLVGNRFGQNCTGTNSDASARTLYNSRLAVYGVQDDLLGTVVEKIVGGQDATRTNPIIVRLYSDRAFTFTGTCTYPAQNGTSITEAINISVSKGWNALVSSTTGTALDLRNVSTDNRVQLVFECNSKCNRAA